jgi:peptide subunit release factor RF-3
MVIALLKKILKGGNKQLLEEKASQINDMTLKPASDLDVALEMERWEREYNAQTPESPMQYSLTRFVLYGPNYFYNKSKGLEVYKNSEGKFFISLSNFALKYSRWNKPFVRLT